jgi:hypothetical protein
VPVANIPVSATIVAKKIDWWKNKCKKTVEHENRNKIRFQLWDWQNKTVRCECRMETIRHGKEIERGQKRLE